MRTMVSRAVAWRWMAACLLGLPLLAACGSEGEDARPPTGASQVGAIAQAQGLMQTGDFAGAEALLVEFTAQEPDSAQAWAMLGLAVHSQQRWEEALALHLKAAEFPVTEGTGLFRAGLAHVQLGEVDQAFDAWQRAKATGTFDITQIGLSPGSAPVREDPRYADLFPTPEQFSEPFVEPVRIIHEWVGENPGDQFGWIARDIGDVDGDGVHDLVTSAPTWGPEGSSRGRVYAYSGRTGALLWVADGEPGDQLGIGVEAAGDVNSDGVPDVIAGGPGGERAVVWSGMDGAVLLELAGQESGEGFGGSVTDVGDLNGDGHDEVLVGAAGNGEAGPGAGAAYLFSGTDGSLLFMWLG